MDFERNGNGAAAAAADRTMSSFLRNYEHDFFMYITLDS